MDMIANKQACFIKQANIFIKRKMIQAINSAMCIGIYGIVCALAPSKQACFIKITNIFT
jgi:hypothetical protein